MKANQIFVNLPVKNIEKTKEFWSKLGFSFNDQISDENALCVVLNETSSVMFLTEKYFETFTNRPVPKGDTTQAIVAIGLDSREEVDQVVNTALANGATQHEEPEDHGWMYQNSFWDINGLAWNVIFADISQFPTQS